MAIFKKRSVAIAVCILLVLTAVLFGGRRSLNAVRQDALTVYTAGDENGLSILANMNSIAEYTSTLLKTAAASYTAGDSVYEDVRTAYNRLLTCADADPAAHRQVLSELLSACTALQLDYSGRSDIPEATAKAMTRSINDIISMKDQIRHSGYNTLAAEFNSTLETFPAGLLGSLTGVKALPLF